MFESIDGFAELKIHVCTSKITGRRSEINLLSKIQVRKADLTSSWLI